MSEGAGDGSSRRASGVEPGALSALLQEVAAAPELSGSEPRSLAPGTVVGRFEVIRELGRGGFGVVYEARDRDLGRQVALKLVRPGRITEDDGRVSREAEAIARLTHPNLVTLYDVGRGEGGPYLVFEFLRGTTLQERLEEGPMPVREALHVATEVARGLAHAHGEGVVHRDLKPSNVFVTSKGQVKILDFGMAHAFGRRRVSGGTPAYMAPEQWEDEPEDERTDVFALGVMLYRMLTGEYPYPEGQGKWAAEPATPRKLDVPGAPELADLVETMLDRKPKARPRDGAAVLATLAPIEERLRARSSEGKPPEHAKRRKATFGDLLAELKRRHVFRVMVGYGLFSFAVLQVTEPVMHGAELPDWVLKAVLVALALGFPVAVILAWLYDLTAQGVRRTPSVAGPGGPSLGRARWLLPLAVSAAVLAIAAAGAGGWYAWKRAGERSLAPAGAAPSIAVLPFKDLSPNQDQEYFSEGVAEEIRTALAGVKTLRVPGRMSSFYFKGRNARPADVGRELRVGHVLEGTVRRSGNRFRITAEVVRASDGERLWSHSFDRELTDMLVVQDEIARAVVDALRVKLFPGQRTLAREPRPASQDAYESYLLGKHLAQLSTTESLQRSLDALGKAVQLSPDFAPAWAALAHARLLYGRRGAGSWSEARREALVAASRAAELDSDLGEAFATRAVVRLADWDWAGAKADLDRAMELSPGDVATVRAMARYSGWMGRTEEELTWARKRVDLEPLDVSAWGDLGAVLIEAGRFDEAARANARALEIEPGAGIVRFNQTFLPLYAGRPAEALPLCEKSNTRFSCEAIAYHALGDARRSQEAVDRMLAFDKVTSEDGLAFVIATVHAYRGETDAAFEWLGKARDRHAPTLNALRTEPFLRSLHADPRWAELLRTMNLPVD